MICILLDGSLPVGVSSRASSEALCFEVTSVPEIPLRLLSVIAPASILGPCLLASSI